MNQLLCLIGTALLLVLFESVSCQEGLPVVEFAPEGTKYEDLPQIKWFSEGSNGLELTIQVATLLARNKNGSILMKVNAPVYRDDVTGDIGPFGPLLKLKRGGNYTVKVTNELEAIESDSILQTGMFANPAHVP